MTAKSAKYLLGSLIPVVGSSVSDAVMAARGCIDLIRTSVGGFGILVIAAIFLLPMVRVLAWYCAFSIGSFLGELLGAKALRSLMDSFASGFGLLLSALTAFAAVSAAYRPATLDGRCRMMDAVRQWAFSLCAAAMACAVIELLLPSISLAKMTRLALSVFFLCVLIQPLGLEAHRSEISLKTGQGMEQAEEYAAEISGRIGEDLSGSARSAVEEELALIGLSPTEYELEIGLGSEQILVTVLLPKDSTVDPAEITDCLEQDPMIQTNVIKEEAE